MSESLAPTRKQHKNRSHPKITKWNQKEDNLLLSLVKNSHHVSWTELPPQFPGKTAQQISERWSKVVDPSLIKGGWTREEDETITNYVAQYGVKNWTKLAKLLPGRIGKQCRERWRNHLDPNNKSGSWTQEEDNLLIKLHAEYGNSWVKIAGFMSGRSDNSIKNRWNSTLKKRVLASGVALSEACPQNITPNLSSPKVGPELPSNYVQEIMQGIEPRNMENIGNMGNMGNIGNISIMHTPEKATKPVDTPDSIPKPEWNGDSKQAFSSDSMWINPFDSPFLSKSPFTPLMKSSFSPWMSSNETLFTPRLMRSPHFGNDASQYIMDILDKE